MAGAVITCTSSGTYTPGAGVTCAVVQAWGGGGGGGNMYWGYSQGGGGGGAGGSFALVTWALSSSATYTVTVGAGGAGGAAGTSPVAGGAGGNSWFDSPSSLLATGGLGGGGGDSNIGGAGGQPQGGSIGSTVFLGGAGASGVSWAEGSPAPRSGGGGGAAGPTGAGGNAVGVTGGTGNSPGGNGANGATTDAVGVAGSVIGGGGSGAMVDQGTTNLAGGAGASGRVIITENNSACGPVANGGCSYAAPTASCGSTGTYTAPSGVSCVKAQVWGAGGAGGGVDSSTGFGGGGGAGGAYAESYVPVTAGATYTATVGGGGTGSLAASGTAGGDSWFSSASTVMAKGGTGGAVSTGATAAGATAPAAAVSVGTIKFAGGNGANGVNAVSGGGGGGAGSGGNGGNAAAGTGGAGAASGGGSGANGLAATGNGNAGSVAGGGGSGGTWNDGPTTVDYAGGNGAAGRVLITEYGLSGGTYTQSPMGVPADGTTSTATVTLATPCGGLAGKTVSLSSSRGSTDTITPVSSAPLGTNTATTSASGVATFTVSSLTCGTATMTAVDTTDSYTLPTLTLAFAATSGATNANSQVAASPTTQLADGSSTSTVTVSLQTAAGCPVSGQSVTLASNRNAAGQDVISPVGAVVTDNAGQAVFTVTSQDWTTLSGLSTYTATVGGLGALTDTATVQWTVPVSGIAFLTPPSDNAVDLPFQPVLQVALYNTAGTLWTGAPQTIRLSITGGTGQLVNGPGQNSMPPNFPVASTVGGIASFPGTAINARGTYTMTASCVSCGSFATPATEPFTVFQTSAPWELFHKDVRATGAAVWNSADFNAIDPVQELAGQAGSPVKTTPVVGDVDNDGDMDLIVASSQANTPAAALQVMGYLQAGGVLPATPTWTTGIPSTMAFGQPATDGSMQLGLGDLDVDGDLELAVYSAYSNIGFGNGALRILNPATGATLAGPQDLTIGYETPLTIGNVDGDAAREVILIHQVGGTAPGDYLAAYSYAGGLITQDFNTLLTATPAIAYSNPVLVEVDGTHAGKELIIGADGGNGVGTLYFCRPAGAASCTAYAAAQGVSDGVHGLAVADLDANGSPELVVNERSTTGATRFALEVFRINGVAPYLVDAAANGDAQYLWNTAAVADVDDDGRNDIANIVHSEYARSVDTNRNGHVYVHGFNGALINKGALLRPGSPTTDFESYGGGILVPTDQATPTRPQFVFGSADGTMNGVRTSPTPIGLDWSLVSTGATAFSAPVAADTSRDCRPEIMIGISSGNTAVLSGVEAQAPGAPSFATFLPASAWTQASDLTSPGSAPTPSRIAKLAWSAPTSNGGLPVAEYLVYRTTGPVGGSPAPAAGYTLVGTWPSGTPPAGVNANDFFVDAPAVDGDYYYRVAAVTCFTRANPATYAEVAGAQPSGPLSSAFYSQVRVPKAPTNLVGVGAVALSWSQPATEPGGVDRPNGCYLYTTMSPPNALTYNVYRRGPGSTGVSPIPGPPIATGLTSPSYNDAAVSNGNAYDYEVTAVNCVGESPRSTLITVVVGNPPAIPANLRVQPFGAPVYATADPAAGMKRVRLDWDAVTSLGDCASLSGYRVYRSPAGTGTWTLLAGVAGVTTYTDATAALGTDYDYAVTSFCVIGAGPNAFESGKQGAPAGLAEVQVPNTTPAPTVTGNLFGNSLVWSDAGSNSQNCGWEEGYYIERQVSTGGPFGAPTILQTVKGDTVVVGTAAAGWKPAPTGAAPYAAPAILALTGLDDTVVPGEVYRYTLRAINCIGAGAGTASLATPAQVGGVTVHPYGDPAYSSVAAKAVEVAWTPITLLGDCAAVTYTVHRAPAGTQTFSQVATGLAASPWTDTTVVVGNSYDYAVQAKCATLSGPYSDVLTADVTLPNTPALPVATPISGGVQVQWVDPGSNNANCVWEEGYRVYRSDDGGAFSAVGLVTGTPQAWDMATPRPLAGWGAPTTAAPLSYDDLTANNPATTYEFKVSAVNCVGESPMSPAAVVTAGNTPPTFTDGAAPVDTQVSSNTPVTIAGWATAISPGAGVMEVNQQLRFVTSFDSGDAALLSSVSVSPTALGPSPWSGDLSYTILANKCGSATYKVILRDDGVMTPPPNQLAKDSVDHFVTITVDCVNTPPTFVNLAAGAPIPIAAADNTVTTAGWATSISPGTGPAEGSQQLRFVVTQTGGSATLLTGLPVVKYDVYTPGPFNVPDWGELSFTVAAEECGSATFSVVLEDDGVMTIGANKPAAQSVLHQLDIDVTCPTNTPPTFLDLGDPAVAPMPLVDTPVTVNGWAHTISAGTTPEEADQELQFVTVYDSGDATMFVTPPSVSPATFTDATGWDGVLTYEVAAFKCGTARYKVNLEDDGEMTIGAALPHAFSVDHFVTININCDNTPPTFTAGADPAQVEQSGSETPVTVANWASAISPGSGAGEVNQKLHFTLELTSGTMAIFQTPPDLAPMEPSNSPWSGTLSYVLAANQCGKAAFKVILHDDGVMTPPPNGPPLDSVEAGLVIYVRCPNTPPTFVDAGNPPPVLMGAGLQTVNEWATQISPGANPEESGQQLRFTVTQFAGAAGGVAGLLAPPGVPVIQSSAFAGGPFTASSTSPFWGRLTYTPAAGKCGVAHYGVILGDNGVMSPGPSPVTPMSSVVHVLSINVTCINGSPSYSGGSTIIVQEDSAPFNAPFLTNIQPGPAANTWESGQRLKFSVTVLTNPGVFTALPVVTMQDFGNAPFTAANGWGRLQFTLAKDRCTSHTGGTPVTFRVTLTDDGATGGPHVNSYTPNTVYTIQVQCVNDPPLFETQNVVVPMNAGPQSMAWTLPLPGPVTALDEQWGTASQQRLRFTTTVASTTNGLTFSQPPSVSQTPCNPTFCNGPYTATNNWGRLTFAATADQFGTAQLNTCLQDSAGILDTTCKTWTLSVVPPSEHVAGGPADPQDHDQDGVATGADNCAGTANPEQTDSGQAGEGDACTTKPLPQPEPEPEPEPEPAPPAPRDFDQDGVPDASDNCVNIANHEQSDFDRDGLGDVCDADIDGDGMSNTDPDGYLDPCPDSPGATGACSPVVEPDIVEDHTVPPAETQTPGGGEGAGNAVGLFIAALGGLLVSGGVAFWALRKKKAP